MYIDGSNAAMGDSAQMLSSECNCNGSLCLHFWYHMYGSATTMTLNIYLHKNNKDTKLWSMMNNQGSIWHPVYIDIKDSAPFQVSLILYVYNVLVSKMLVASAFFLQRLDLFLNSKALCFRTAFFQIIVEGIRGSNDQSDVAIDDISLNFGSCSGNINLQDIHI